MALCNQILGENIVFYKKPWVAIRKSKIEAPPITLDLKLFSCILDTLKLDFGEGISFLHFCSLSKSKFALTLPLIKYTESMNIAKVLY